MKKQGFRTVERREAMRCQLILAIRHLEKRLALDPFQIGQVTSHGLTGRSKLLTRLGQVQVTTHAHERAQHGYSDATGTFGLIQFTTES